MNRFNKKMSLVDLGGRFQKSDLNSSVTTRCLEVINIPIENLSAGDLRMLITQSIGLEFLVETAIEMLEQDILLNSELYKGDLLIALLNAPNQFWSENVELNNRLVEMKIDAEEIFETLKNEILPSMDEFDYM